MKKFAPIFIENSDVYEITLTIKEDGNLKNRDSRRRTFIDSKKITRKSSDISFHKIELAINDLSNFWFNRKLQELWKEKFKKEVSLRLKTLILDLRTLSNIAYWVITISHNESSNASLKLKEEYKKLEDEIIENIASLLSIKNTKSKILWEYREEDLNETFKEISNYIRYHKNEIENFKHDFFVKGAKNENIGLYFYKF